MRFTTGERIEITNPEGKHAYQFKGVRGVVTGKWNENFCEVLLDGEVEVRYFKYSSLGYPKLRFRSLDEEWIQL